MIKTKHEPDTEFSVQHTLDDTSSGGPMRIRARTVLESSPAMSSTDSRQRLRCSILSKRRARGENEIELEQTTDDVGSCQLTAEEKEKRERRKEQNRRAAKKCRQKKKERQSSVKEDQMRMMRENLKLEEEKLRLEQEVSCLSAVLEQHANSGTCKHQSNSVHCPFASSAPDTLFSSPDLPDVFIAAAQDVASLSQNVMHPVDTAIVQDPIDLQILNLLENSNLEELLVGDELDKFSSLVSDPSEGFPAPVVAGSDRLSVSSTRTDYSDCSYGFVQDTPCQTDQLYSDHPTGLHLNKLVNLGDGLLPMMENDDLCGGAGDLMDSIPNGPQYCQIFGQQSDDMDDEVFDYQANDQLYVWK